MKKLKELLKKRAFRISVLLIITGSFLFFYSSAWRSSIFHLKLSYLRFKTDKVQIIPNDGFNIITFECQNLNSFWNCMKFKIPKPGHLRACACLGNSTVYFYSKNQKIDFFTLHHGKHIRWKRFPFGDISFTPQASKELLNLLAKHKSDI